MYNYTGETGTYRYMAPEVYRHEPYNGKADVYRCVCWIQIVSLFGRPLSMQLDMGRDRAVDIAPFRCCVSSAALR